MAKITSVVNFSGKLGNLVGMQGQDGQMYVRIHRNHINNPNTMEQIIARTKLSLVGNLSKLFPADVLYGMSGNGKRGRRHRWVKVMMRRITVTQNDNSVSAFLRPENLILSEGNPFYGITINNIAIAEGNVTMNIDFSDENTKALVVAAFADSQTGHFLAVDSKVADTEGAFSIPLPQSTFQVANLYAIPIVGSSELSTVQYDDSVEADGDTVSSYSSMATFYNSSNYKWMQSQFLGSFSAD